ncbi:MlaE family ABC transporter permease [Thermospira aquatica]|uniref:ABC transporter permease n=1 Tax=Thermospira aquatica TaxID=2828656 RepID=A0AAX3BET7_9SPIR|nr:ABC transporter permease [Thermospira aquatica]URA10770.1 ABC transporter permease [Thermospira aquatica]
MNFKERVLLFFHETGEFFLFFFQAVKKFRGGMRQGEELVKQIYMIGFESIPVVILTGLFSGLIMGLSLGNALESIIMGTAQYLSGGLSVALVKELGPVLTALIVVSRVCSSVTAHLGTMRVTEQIDALETMGVDPVEYLVVPRVMAGMISLPILGLISIVFSLVGGWMMISGIHGVQTSVYIEWAQIPLKINYIVESLFKMIFIGGFILMVSTFEGFRANGGAAGVGNATIRSVVTSSVMVIFLDYVLGTLFMIVSGGGV